MLIVTFGYRYKREAPIGASLILDARCLAEDPAEKKDLGPLFGTDRQVQEYLEKLPDVVDFRDVAVQTVASAKLYGCQTIAIGCHSGRHRSVYIAEYISHQLQLPVQHLDMTKEPVEDCAPDYV